MKTSILFLLTLLVAGCDPGSANGIEDQMRSDALSRASSDCGAAGSCRVTIKNNEDDWIVTVSPTALGIAGDPQFNSGAVHYYHYDASGVFVRETAE